jgi:predicted secreted Zn-dependent protease
MSEPSAIGASKPMLGSRRATTTSAPQRDVREKRPNKFVGVTDATERLRRRYPKPRMPRPLLVGMISVAVVLALTWLIWAALRYSQPVAAAHVQAFQITSDTSVAVTISVQRRDPSVPVTCRVLAQAEDFQPVGEQQVLVTASPRKIIDVDLVLTTLRRATGVVIKECTVA